MIYVLELYYDSKETLPIIRDIWHVLQLIPLSPDENVIIDHRGEWMAFKNLAEFKEWATDEMEEDPIFLVVDLNKKDVYFYEVTPTVKIEKLTVDDIKEAHKERERKIREFRKKNAQ